jgi:hypothetical protein
LFLEKLNAYINIWYFKKTMRFAIK